MAVTFINRMMLYTSNGLIFNYFSILFLLLVVGDITTTAIALSMPGHQEMNAFPAFVMSINPILWYLSYFIGALIIVYALHKLTNIVSPIALCFVLLIPIIKLFLVVTGNVWVILK